MAKEKGQQGLFYRGYVRAARAFILSGKAICRSMDRAVLEYVRFEVLEITFRLFIDVHSVTGSFSRNRTNVVSLMYYGKLHAARFYRVLRTAANATHAEYAPAHRRFFQREMMLDGWRVLRCYRCR